jgi:excisionase family DNA binding protein
VQNQISLHDDCYRPPLSAAKLLLSINEVKQQTGLGRTTIYKAIALRQLPILKVGSRTVVPYAGLVAWIGSLQAQTTCSA